ncbi:MAG: MBL fold metallo-hydrolase [bacterium JZ-2024 1]
MSVFLTSLSSGSCGNCLVLQVNDDAYLVDVGIGVEQIEKGIEQIGISWDCIRGIFVTHEHRDHIQGLEGVIRKRSIPVIFPRALQNWSPLSACLNAGSIPFEPSKKFYLGKMEVLPVPVPHDAISPVGFVFSYCGVQIGYFVDLGSVPSSLLNFLKQVDVLVIESNHDVRMLEEGPYPEYLKKRISGPEGHLSNMQTGKFLQQMTPNLEKPVQVFLAHLSEVNNTPEVALQTVKDMIRSRRNSERVFLDYFPRGMISKMWVKHL